jgi:hypothetical protein
MTAGAGGEPRPFNLTLILRNAEIIIHAIKHVNSRGYVMPFK